MAKSLLLLLLSILFLSFTVKAIGSDSNSTQIFIGDFNGDGYADYITKQTGDGANQTIELLLSRGNGKFNNCDLSEAFGSDLSDFNLYIGDFNGDGKDDILRQDKKGLITTNTTLSVCLMISDGLGSFESHVLPDSFQLIGANLYIGDFNGDGKADIFRQSKGFLTPESGSTSWASWVLFATGGPDFFRTLVLPLELELNGDKTNLYVGDFNGDGLDDILRQEKGSFAADGTNTANLLLFQVDESFEKIVLSEDYNLNGDLTVLHIGDFNGDGIDDILRREKSMDYNSDVTQLMLSLDQGIFEVINLDENYNLGGDSGNVYIGDFNDDGKTDLLRQDNNIQIIEVFLSTGDSFDRFELDKSQYDADQTDTVATFYVGDFNADGNDDILKSTNSDNKIYYSNGNGSFS